jgi:hypothetical protein
MSHALIAAQSYHMTKPAGKLHSAVGYVSGIEAPHEVAIQYSAITVKDGLAVDAVYVDGSLKHGIAVMIGPGSSMESVLAALKQIAWDIETQGLLPGEITTG